MSWHIIIMSKLVVVQGLWFYTCKRLIKGHLVKKYQLHTAILACTFIPPRPCTECVQHMQLTAFFYSLIVIQQLTIYGPLLTGPFTNIVSCCYLKMELLGAKKS